MRSNYLKTLKTAVLAVTVLLLGASISLAQQQVNLTAGPATATMPDGTAVPMWGYSCGLAAAGSTATCGALRVSPKPVPSTTWSPVVIMVPSGQTLQINLTNMLSFTPLGASTANGIPTSLVIVGQVGGGLGSVGATCTGGGTTCTDSPDHSGAQSVVTWPIVGSSTDATPPTQARRVQSFSTEVAPLATTSLTWTAPRPGTYLLESGTHPSIQGPMGLYGMVVVTSPVVGTTPGTAYPAVGTVPAVTYSAEIPLLFSEIDPVQNAAVSAAVNTAGFTETKVWSGQPGGCGNPASGLNYQTCYPPAVNYTPLYYLINGTAFDKTTSGNSLFPTLPATGVAPNTGQVLVRMVNAGLRMHVPSIVGAQTAGLSQLSGFQLIAEDGNVLPGVSRVQSEVFMAAGKTYDVIINAPSSTNALPVYDRELSLSGNAITRDAGMLAYISVNNASIPSTTVGLGAPVAVNDAYNSLTPCPATPCPAFIVSDVGKGVIANDFNVYGVQVLSPPTNGKLTLNADGTFSYVPNAAGTTPTPDSFTYQANGNPAIHATVQLGAALLEDAIGITMNPIGFTSNLATFLSIKPPGILVADSDSKGFPLTVSAGTVVPTESTLKVTVDPNGGFNATVPSPGTYHFTYKAQNSQGVVSSSTATVTLTFPQPSNLSVNVVDGVNQAQLITDYRWIIEEDRTFFIDPNNTTNNGAAGTTTVPTYGVNFHTSYMPLVATGCTGPLSCESGQQVFDPTTSTHVNAVCDMGNGVCRPDTAGTGQTAVLPSQVVLDPSRRYYISVLPGDAANPFIAGNLSASCASDGSDCGHGMGGSPIPAACTPATGATTCTGSFAPVKVISEPTPLQTAKLSVFVFEDDFPLNGEQDAGGGIDILAPNEPGLGGFNITLFDDAGGSGDATGQMTYDMFNMPLSNSLSGTIDPSTGMDACPISKGARLAIDSSGDAPVPNQPSATGITGTIVTCPKFESDGVTLSPLAGQAVVANLMPGRYGVVATPAADRIARGEQWLQTNTLDGQKAHDSFLRVGEPSFFQEFGPAGYHVTIGFANPAIINGRKNGICRGTDPNVTITGSCNHTLKGSVSTERMSRTPDQRLYGSGSYDSFGFSQCYVSIGDPDGEDFAFTKCDQNGNFTFTGLPSGTWRVTVFDQWNDMLVDGLSTPVGISSSAASTTMPTIAMNQWQANIYTQTFYDQNFDGVKQDSEPGLALVATNIRFRDGSYSNFNNTDLGGSAGFNEVFPLFAWYVIETDTTRYKSTGTHVVYDAGGPADGTTDCGPSNGFPPCGSAAGYAHMANTAETFSVPTDLRVPGAVYCNNADCPGKTITSPSVSDPPSPCTTTSGVTTCTPSLSTGRIDPPWISTYGWQGFSGQNSFIDFGKTRFADTENGGIHGEVIYASTRPFDDPALLIHTSWTPDVPGVTINLYQESTNPDTGATTLTLVDHTTTSSWDDWAQGFRAGTNTPNMSCPGQSTADLFYFSLFGQQDYLDLYNAQHTNTTGHTIPYNSQYKCYDGMHNWNQLQPAPYDGMYQFPSVTGVDANGKPTTTNCTVCKPNPDTADVLRVGTPMLPAGKYVVEMVVPPGYELVKEEDKNILIGDNYIAPATQQFAGLGDIFILPDQAAVGTTYNANNAQNPTTALGATPRHEGDTGSVETFWPCVGAARIVPEFISLFPGSQEVSPFAGATRNLCDRKEVVLDNQMSVLAKFWVFTSVHAAAHYTGIITDDFTSEFDPFSPQFGEKFSPPDLPVSVKDFKGNEISRTYTDHWGFFDGLNYSTWEVNPPNPTGYAPTMMVTCMNDPGPIKGPNGSMITDPTYNPNYSQFCYEIPFMPGQTQYMDTPVVPTSAFAGAGYNNPDCAYPALTPAIGEVDGNDVGPWVAAPGATLKIYTINGKNPVTGVVPGDDIVNNYGYSGPSATIPPYNQKKVTRHFGFGSSTGTVTIGGISGAVTAWNDQEIDVTVPPTVPACAIQQQAQYGGSNALCGQLVITTSTGQQSIDSITVTVGGKAPHRLASGETIQSAIDGAAPGDLIIVPPGTYNELLLMWKPVRLQGVGATSSIINATTHPAGKLDPWRRQVNCLMGLAVDGQPFTSSSGKNPYDVPGGFQCPGTGWTNYHGGPNNPQVDRIPLEGVVGWDTTVNGNLAELLQEPSLMGAYEGAAITVLAKGVRYPAGVEVFGVGADTGSLATESQMPLGTVLLTNTSADCNTARGGTGYSSNFLCNPSRIDGLGITNSSQGGGGIFVHGWGHSLEISNNRIYNNTGTLSGGINVGQGESPDALLTGNNGDPVGFDQTPGTCDPAGFNPDSSHPTGFELPFCYNTHVNVHNNYVTSNSSIGDELFSATPAGAGGVTFCTGADYYKFNNNWVCGNLSTGDGGGLGQLGFAIGGDIEHNAILFNQSTNPTIPTNGGGIIIMGSAPDGTPAGAAPGTECGSVTDVDCAPGLSDGTGAGLKINANMIMGNAAESGSGGGIRLQSVNGTEVTRFPSTPAQWYSVDVTNNIIANNVAGWDGGGVSLQDSLVVNFINNTVISNDTTASSGVLFNTLGAPEASAPGVPCTTGCGTASPPQPAGLVTMRHSSNLTSGLTGPITCPAGHFVPGTSATNGTCRNFSYPELYNNLFWQNHSYHIGVGSLSAQFQQNIVTLYNAPSTFDGTLGLVAPSQAATGACTTATYWEIGVRGDTSPTAPATGNPKLAPTFSVLTDAADYPGLNNSSANPTVFSQYCNGSRVPPEAHLPGGGWQVPPGIADATVPNPVFNLTPAATVDEGNNWINLSWGPLALANPSTGAILGDYRLQNSSPAIDYIGSSASTYAAAPSDDFFGPNHRKTATNPCVDVGAVDVSKGTTCGGSSGGGGGTTPPFPAPPLLDNFNRANATNLNTGAPAGVAWNVGGLLGSSSVGILTQRAFSLVSGNAYWAGTGDPFGNRQAAAFTFASTPVNNTGLVLKATLGTSTAPANYVRVRYQTGGSVTVATVTGGAATTVATLTGFGGFANGDTLTAMVDATGAVNVWKTSGGTTTLLTSSPVATTFTGTGRIGMQLGPLTTVDSFAGGNVP